MRHHNKREVITVLLPYATLFRVYLVGFLYLDSSIATVLTISDKGLLNMVHCCPLSYLVA